MMNKKMTAILGIFVALIISGTVTRTMAQTVLSDPAVTSTASGPVSESEAVAKNVSERKSGSASMASRLKPIKKNTQTDSDTWKFSFAPYLFAAGVKGTVGARGRTLEVDAKFTELLKNFDIGLMGTLEAKRGKFFILNDLMWMRLSSDRNTAGPLFTNVKIGVNMVIIEPDAGYRIVETKAGSLDILGGVRIWSVENTLTATAGALPGFGASQRKTFVAPVAGLRGLLNLSPKFFLTTKVDAGAGSGTHSTAQFFGGAGIRIKPRVSLIGGYRYLHVNHDDDSGFIFDTRMSGLILGAKFAF